jgi:hypothetical protein
MSVEELIGVNTFHTADNVCGVIRMYRAGLGISLQDLVKGAKYMHFQGIDDPVFAKTLFEYLLKYQGREESLITNLLLNIEEGLDDMKALMEAVNFMEK